MRVQQPITPEFCKNKQHWENGLVFGYCPTCKEGQFRKEYPELFDGRKPVTSSEPF